MQSNPARRPSSIPPRPSADAAPQSRVRPSTVPPPAHQDLAGASGNAVRFRPARLAAAELPLPLTCRFRCDGVEIGPLAVLDLSSTGFAARASEELALAPGSALESLELLIDGRSVWAGEAVVVHENTERIGARFVSGMVDLRHIVMGATVEGRLSLLAAQRAKLPAEWRAAVSDLYLLLESARLEVDEFERERPPRSAPPRGRGGGGSSTVSARVGESLTTTPSPPSTGRASRSTRPPFSSGAVTPRRRSCRFWPCARCIAGRTRSPSATRATFE